MNSEDRANEVRIVTFEDRFRGDFERLNLLWLEGFGLLESADLPYLRDPRGTILARGGEVYFALMDDRVVGACGVVPRGRDEFELVKLAVDPAARGAGIGRRLTETALEFARAAGASRITLCTNSRLTAALRLYERLGFEPCDPPADPDYATADVHLSRNLSTADSATRFRIAQDDLRSNEVHALLAEHLADMYSISPPESVHALGLEELRRPDVTFWTIWIEDHLAGCGALKALDPRRGEIKSMRTASAQRRRGVAKAMLLHILDEAKRRGYAELLLETGSQPEFLPARRLYEAFGFTYRGPFEGYRDDPNSLFMEKRLAARI